MSNRVFLRRMPNGIPGATNRDSQNTIEPIPFSRDSRFDAFGVPGKVDEEGKFVPLAAGDELADIYGILVRPYPTNGGLQNDFGAGSPGQYPYGGNIANVLRRGYMTVLNTTGVPALNKPVYVQVANGTAVNPVGSFRADASADAVEINAIFMDAGDENGNAEIAYNI